MGALTEVSKTLSGMSPEALIAVVALAGLAVAAFAIYAVLVVTREHAK